MPIIELRNVNKYFGSLHVLQNINLTVEKGEVVVIIGSSGSGKSTLCRTINRLEPIDSGEILIAGEPILDEGKRLVELRKKVGMVFQQFNLFEHKKIIDNVTLALRKVLHMPKAKAEANAMELLRRVGVESQAQKYPAELSGGQQQRAAIARALAMRPEVLLFDEPTSALDPEMINEVLSVMTELAKSGMTMVIVTHEMSFARSVASRIVFMDSGQIIEEASAKEFFDNPQTQRAKDFLSSLNRAEN